MTDWKSRLFNSYVSTGQTRKAKKIKELKNPYYDTLISRHLPRNAEIAIADLACGNGRLIYNLKMNGYKNVIGVDISQEQVAVAHHFKLDEVKLQDLNKFLEETKQKSFDVVFLMDILEHLEKQETLNLLDNVNRILRANGIIVIHVPNGAGLFGMRMRYSDFTHQNAFTSQSMQQILLACNFDMIKCFEDVPVIYGLKSLIRFIIWKSLTLTHRLLLAAETGKLNGHILSQNMLVTAQKTS